MGSSPILIWAGNKLIGGLSALVAGGCEFKSHFLDKDHLYGLLFIEHKSVKREFVGISNFISYDGYIKYIDYNEGEHHRLKKFALEWSLLTLTATLFLWASFDGEGQFQAIKKLE